MFRNIVTALDGSQASERALDAALHIASRDAAHLHILNVPDGETTTLIMSAGGDYVPLTPAMEQDDLKAAGRQVVQNALEYCEDAGFWNATTHVRIGSPAQEVLALASEIGADLIVTGRRGLGTMARVVLGSTSHAILTGANCACLSVP